MGQNNRSEERIYEEGIESGSKGFAIFENAVIAVTIVVGAMGLCPLLNIAGCSW